jgi:hypothetical protein
MRRSGRHSAVSMWATQRSRRTLAHDQRLWGVSGTANEVAQFAIEVRDTALWTGERADDHVALSREALLDQAQGGALAGAGRADDGGKAAVLDEHLDTLGEAFETRGDGERLDGDIGGEGIPLEGIGGE